MANRSPIDAAAAAIPMPRSKFASDESIFFMYSRNRRVLEGVSVWTGQGIEELWKSGLCVAMGIGVAFVMAMQETPWRTGMDWIAKGGGIALLFLFAMGLLFGYQLYLERRLAREGELLREHINFGF